MSNELPKRTADTMSDAIAMGSPSGRTSKRAKTAAARRLEEALFGPGGLTADKLKGTSDVPERPRHEQIKDEIASLRGYIRMAGPRQGKKLLAKIQVLEGELKGLES